MLNEDVGRMENADESLIISNWNPRKAEKIIPEFTSGSLLLEEMTNCLIASTTWITPALKNDLGNQSTSLRMPAASLIT